jgi:protein SSD1
MIEGGSLPSSVTVCGDHDKAELAKDILVLNGLAQQLRKRRSQNGSLRIDRDRLMFNLDENGTPFDCYNYAQSDSNRLIEEFMLLTNLAVAQQIAANLPEQALLRRHEEPIERRIVSRDSLLNL